LTVCLAIPLLINKALYIPFSFDAKIPGCFIEGPLGVYNSCCRRIVNNYFAIVSFIDLANM